MIYIMFGSNILFEYSLEENFVMGFVACNVLGKIMSLADAFGNMVFLFIQQLRVSL